MSERYKRYTNNALGFASNPHAIDKLCKRVEDKLGVLRTFSAEDAAWKEAYSTRLNAEPTEEQFALASEILMVYMAASAFTGHKLYEEVNAPLTILRDKYHQSLPDAQLLDTSLVEVFRADRFGITAADIFKRGDRLVQEQPAEVYGYMLRSAVLPSDKDALVNGVHAFVPIVIFSTDSLVKIAKHGQFPGRIKDTLIGLSTLYRRALKQVKSGFFDPNSEHFAAAVTVYDNVFEYGTNEQRDIFYAQVLGFEGDRQGQDAYSKARRLIEQGVQVELYSDVIINIENAFDGYFGEDAYEPLGIAIQPDASIDTETYTAAHAKKRDLLNLVKNTEGTISLGDGYYGNIFLSKPTVRYRKNGNTTYAMLEGSAEACEGDHIDIQLSLGTNNSYEWNFLRTHEEVPELFNEVLYAASQAFDSLLPQPQRAITPVRKESSAPKERNNDPVYQLRKETRRAIQEDERSVIPVLSPTREVKRWPVEFAEDKKRGVSEDLCVLAESAIEKYDNGLGNIEKMHDPSKNGRALFRLRNGEIRVLLELDEDTGRLVVYRVDWRKDVYRR